MVRLSISSTIASVGDSKTGAADPRSGCRTGLLTDEHYPHGRRDKPFLPQPIARGAQTCRASPRLIIHLSAQLQDDRQISNPNSASKKTSRCFASGGLFFSLPQQSLGN